MAQTPAAAPSQGCRGLRPRAEETAGGHDDRKPDTRNCVDAGTSILIEAEVRGDFTAETALRAVADLLRRHGVPEAITIARDPRFVGSPGGWDFPSPLLRFLTCLAVEVVICPPHRPDVNGFIERYHRTYNSECLQVHRPATLEQERVR